MIMQVFNFKCETYFFKLFFKTLIILKMFTKCRTERFFLSKAEISPVFQEKLYP